jgi:hypothetical protein
MLLLWNDGNFRALSDELQPLECFGNLDPAVAVDAQNLPDFHSPSHIPPVAGPGDEDRL